MSSGAVNLIIWAAILGLIPGYIAYRKGHSFVGYWAFGALLWVVALPVAIFMKPDEAELETRRLKRGEHRCPHCRAFVRTDAGVCPNCRRDISAADLAQRSAPQIKVSFREPMIFPAGTSLYTAKDDTLAVLSDGSVIVDDGAAGVTYPSMSAYRARADDLTSWTLIREFTDGPSLAELGAPPMTGERRLARPPRKKLRALVVISACAVAVLAIIVVLVSLPDIWSELKVEAQGTILSIQNVGDAPITITRIDINGRSDCKLRTGILGLYDFQQTVLKIGDTAVWNGNCNIVRATIVSNNGTNAYEF